MACTFQAIIGGKFAPLTGLRNEDMDIITIIATYKTAVTGAASEILGQERRRKKPWVISRAGYRSVFSIRYSYQYKLIDIRYII